MKTKLVSLLLTVAMLASATLIPTSATAEEVTPDATPVSDGDTSVTEATPMPEETPLAEAEPEASPAPVVDAPAATVADESYFTYTVTGGKATITDVNNSISGDIIIPDTLGGYPVTSIGSSAFEYCSSLTSVTIPDSVTSIGSYAFYVCSSLTSVTIGNSVTSIGERAFYWCDKLIEVYNRSSLSITKGSDSYGYVGYYAKDVYTSMSSVSKFFTLGDYLFYNDNGSYLLMEYQGTDSDISLPDTVNGKGYAIYKYAFYNRNDLTSVIIPDSVTSIGERAFYRCSSLTSVTIPDSVTRIGNYAFCECSSLTSVIIPDSVTSIGNYAFRECSSLTSVTIGNSVTSIGSSAFSNCDSLTSVTIGNSVTSVGMDAFSNCDSLTSVTIPDSVTSIGYAAFSSCSSLTSVTIGNSVTSIGSSAFQYCFKLIEVYNRSSLSITAGSSYGDVGYYAKNVYTPSSGESKLFTFGDFLFYNDNGSYLLMEYQGNDTAISLPDTVNGKGYEIYKYAFYRRDDLTSVTIGDSVTSIGEGAFFECSSLTSVTIGNSVTSIGEDVFEHCYKLIEVYNRSSLSITKGSSSYGYVGYYAKNVYTPSSGKSKLFTFGDYLFYNDNGSYLLVAYTVDDTDITLTDTVNGKGYAIYQYAFCNRDDLTSVTIPDSVTSIGSWAFYSCDSLALVTIKSATIARKLTSYDSCGYLVDYAETVIIPASITTVGSYVTSNFTNRDAITMDGVLYTGYSKHTHADDSVWDENTCTLCGLYNPCRDGHDMQGATCDTPSTCSRCGHTEGDPLGHDMQGATCTAPDICTRCGVEGEALGHDMQDATCTLPSTCSRCDHTEGEELGHVMAPADCVTPSTCTRCGHTEGDALGHVMAPADCLTPSACKRCGHMEGRALGHDVVIHEEKIPTCTETGHDAYVTCSRCDYTTYVEKPALGHDMQEATCTLPSICSRCGHTEGDPLGHYVWVDTTETVDAVVLQNATNYPFSYSGGWYTSTNKADGSTADFKITAAHATTLVIKYSVSSESGWDKLFILKNGLQLDAISGSVSGKTLTITLGVGDVVTIRYGKDGSVSKGSDNGSFTIVSGAQVEIDSLDRLPAEECEPTCENSVVCDDCGNVIISALGHDMQDATCIEPSTCTRCGHTEGDSLGHAMAPADCLTPSTCDRCGHTVGDALGHVMAPADCVTPSTCTRCGHTEGDALGHDMQDATCTLPSTCSRCGHAEGEALGHAWGDWGETVAPTHSSDGEEKRVCANDPTHIETRVIPAYTFIEQWVCGDGVTAELYPDDKNEGKYLLVIDGTGAMNNFGSKTMPWADHITEITTVIVYDGVTSIGASAFYGATALTSLTLSASVTSIGDSAFRNCTALTSVSEMASMDTIGKYAFFGCTAIPALAFGEDAKLSSVGLAAFLNCTHLQLVSLKNETAIAALTARTAHGYMINVATTILLPKGATAPTFITTNYTYVNEVMDEGVAYTVYSKHSHAEDAPTWSDDTCTECGVTRGGLALLAGDINADGVTDIADIVAVINSASGTTLDPEEYPGATDVTADGVTDIADIVAVINIASGSVA